MFLFLFSLTTCTHHIHHILPADVFEAKALQKQTETKRGGTAYVAEDH